MPDYNLSFSSSSSHETGSYKLLQLTPDLNSLIEHALDNGEALRLLGSHTISPFPDLEVP